MNQHEHEQVHEHQDHEHDGREHGQLGHGQFGIDRSPDPQSNLVMLGIRDRLVGGGMSWRRAFPGRGDQAAPARHLVKLLLLDTPCAEDAEWVAAELISNALRHTRSGTPGGYFLLEVQRGLHTARVITYDLGGHGVPNFGVAFGSGAGQNDLDENGHGLRGVAALAVKVGVAGDPIIGHAVWAELSLATRDSEEQAQTERHGQRDSRFPAEGELPAEVGASPAQPLQPLEEGSLLGHVLPGTAELSGAGGMLAGLPDVFAEGVVAEAANAAGEVSAFGQEPWAQQELQRLRREYPDWGFLVVHYRWVALRGREVVILASSPRELRAALSPAPDRQPASESGGAGSDPEIGRFS